jgi:hypothetical protein
MRANVSSPTKNTRPARCKPLESETPHPERIVDAHAVEQEVLEFEARRTDLILVAIIGSIALFMCLYVAHGILM